MFAALPPIIAAILALTYAFFWHAAGASLLARIVRMAGLSGLAALSVAWLAWLPVCGALALVPTMFGVASTPLFLAAGGLVLMGGAWCWRRDGRSVRGVFVPRNLSTGPRAFKVLAAIALGLKAIEAIFAAHPQRLYDQLNYHLVVAKHALATGGLPTTHYDPHLAIAGLVEYAFLWPRSVFQTDELMMAAAQAWVFVAVIGSALLAVLLMSAKLSTDARRSVMIAAMAAIPALIPDNEFCYVAKPNGLALSGALLMLALSEDDEESYAPRALAISMLLVAANQTFAHAAIAFAVLCLAKFRRSINAREFRRASPLLLVGALCLVISMTKGLVIAGTPFYPSDAKLLSSPLADQFTLDYWRFVAFGSEQEPLLARAMGAVLVPGRNPLFWVWITLALTLSRRSLPPRPTVVRIFGFIAVYATLWPLFYGAKIYSRFVLSYLGALTFLGLQFIAAARDRAAVHAVAATLILGLGCSHLDVMLRKIGEWNFRDRTTSTAISGQWPRYHTVESLKPLMARVGLQATILTDAPEKYFFDARVLSGMLSPIERGAYSDLVKSPREAALRLRLAAIVATSETRSKADSPSHWDGPLNAVWESLRPFGVESEVGDDRVLASECFFQRMPCD